jgi:signal transduction histidine kinase
MRRAAWIFLAAILLPCLGLAWLAIRSEQDQQVILQHQQAIIDQGVADSLAQNVRTQMDGIIADFVRTTRQLLTTAGSPAGLADGFDHKIVEAWPPAQVGFAVDLQGVIYAPERSDGPPAQIFRKENESFLSNREDAEVYSNAQNELTIAPAAPAMTISTPTAAPISVAQTKQASAGSSSIPAVHPPPPEQAAPSVVPTDALEKSSAKAMKTMATPDQSAVASTASLAPASSAYSENRSTAVDMAAAAPALPVPSMAMPSSAPRGQDKQNGPADSSALLAQAPVLTTPTAALSAHTSSSLAGRQQIARVERQVAPQENTRAPDAALSNVVPAQSDFRQLIGQSTSGLVARFLEDKLCLLVWSLPSAHDSIVFGAQIDQDKLVDNLRALVQPDANRSRLDSSSGGHADYCLALLDDKGRPVALSQAGFSTDWKHPFVATEIGGVLPHWEAALYLTDPGRVSHSARVLHFTIGLIIVILVVAILAGGSLIGADVGRQMRLAQQKTDFVSNVSHELKTPLTSIRMFADMLAEGRVEDGEKQAAYLRIISAESARLTRLINNVLDFARMERGAPAGEQHPCDLVETARDVVETCLPHLESTAVTLGFEVEAESLPVLGDRDGLSQIILNLISNAEKYGGGEVTVRVRRQDTPAGPIGYVDVLDRGPGIPARQVETAFEPFQRLDDSLAGGVPGSGLGLTLARRMARSHGGDITYQPRAGGGSSFTLALPLSPRKS